MVDVYDSAEMFNRRQEFRSYQLRYWCENHQDISNKKPVIFQRWLNQLNGILDGEAIELKFDQSLIELINRTIRIIEDAIEHADKGKLNEL